MRNKYGCLAMAVLLIAGSAFPVHAEEYTGRDDWKAQFTGKKLESNFESADLAEAIYALQPGDQITIQLALENQHNKPTDWYMTNEVLSSLEDSQSSASGGAYTYELTYVNHKGETSTLYSSENVGGEKSSAAGEGLHEVTDNMDEFFYLDRLASGENGHIGLTVALDGETQGNGYQNTLAKLQLAFAVEPVTGGGGGNGGGSGGDDGNTPRTPPPSTPTSATVYQVGSVQTGDASHILLWSAIALGAGLILTIIAITRLRQEKGGNDDEA